MPVYMVIEIEVLDEGLYSEYVRAQFEDEEGCSTCFRSKEYREIAHLRESSTRSRSIIVEGLTTPLN